jgi:hypothetical protein
VTHVLATQSTYAGNTPPMWFMICVYQPLETGIGGVGNKKVTSKHDHRYHVLTTIGVSKVANLMIALAAA